jgi:predicted Na+-dependent transporter
MFKSVKAFGTFLVGGYLLACGLRLELQSFYQGAPPPFARAAVWDYAQLVGMPVVGPGPTAYVVLNAAIYSGLETVTGILLVYAAGGLIAGLQPKRRQIPALG